jgi:hypothetical protein
MKSLKDSLENILDAFKLLDESVKIIDNKISLKSITKREMIICEKVIELINRKGMGPVSYIYLLHTLFKNLVNKIQGFASDAKEYNGLPEEEEKADS